MLCESLDNTNEVKSETPEEYRETCHCFKLENERYYLDNNFYRGTLLPLEIGNPRDENAGEILEEVREYYETKGDDFNMLRYHEKIEDKEGGIRLAEKIERNGTLLERAHAFAQIWKHFKDNSYREKAVEAYAELARGYENGGDSLMAAIYNDLLFKITKKEECREKAISFHRQSAQKRKAKGDSWWEAISLREIGKLSKGTENQSSTVSVAVIYANQEIQRAKAAGDYKNAGLWARDIFKLTGTPESRERARRIFLIQIEKSKQLFKKSGKSDDLRTVAKSYWEMWKVTNEEEHRVKALEHYKKLLQKAKEEKDEKQKEECYRVLLYITQ